jgi:CO/xanthine dehydrogenase Mo-binding subunit
MPGVVRILTGKDVPRNLNTLLSLLDFGIDDEPDLQPTVFAIAESRSPPSSPHQKRGRDAVAKVAVDWEPLPHVLDVGGAIKPGAPVVLILTPAINSSITANMIIKVRYGDVEAAFRQADHIVEGRYQMSPIEQAPIETCGAIATPEQNGRYACYSATQALFFSLAVSSKVLEMPSSRLHFIGGTVGGGFGGKVDSIHEPLAILGTMLTGRPCKCMWDREEMQVGAPRGAVTLVYQGWRDARWSYHCAQFHRLF